MDFTCRAVDRFPEPEFTRLVHELLHEPGHQGLLERLFPSTAPVPQATPGDGLERIRIGAYQGETMIGWTSGWREPGAQVHVGSSAVLPAYRRRGVYAALMAAMEAHARSLGCLRISSCHRPDNAPVLIAKLKAGYVITGTEFHLEMGLLVRMTKFLEEQRAGAFSARLGPIERTCAYFGTSGG